MATVLHPLVLTNMCDHYDRVRRLDAEAASAGGGAAPSAGASEGFVHVPGAPVCGLLFGLQTSQKVDICTSIEAHVVATTAAAAAAMGEDPANVGGAGEAAALPWALDAPLIARWIKLCEPIYPGHELLGWYTMADELTPQHQAFHSQMRAFNEIPLLLHLRPSGLAVGMTEVPLTLLVGQQKADAVEFVPQAFVVEPSDTERTAVENIFTGLTGGIAAKRSGGSASASASGGASSSSATAAAATEAAAASSPAVASAASKLAALRILGERVDLIKGFVDGLIAGSSSSGGGGGGASSSSSSSASAAAAPRKASSMPILRSIRSLLNRLPVEEAEAAQEHEAVDALLIATCAGVVAGQAGEASLLDKVTALGGSLTEQGSGGGGRGSGRGVRSIAAKGASSSSSSSSGAADKAKPFKSSLT